MPTGSHKKRGTTIGGKPDGELPLPVRSFKDPHYTARNYLQKKRISAVRRKIGIPGRNDYDSLAESQVEILKFNAGLFYRGIM